MLKLHTQCYSQEDDYIFYTLCKQTGLSMYKAMPALLKADNFPFLYSEGAEVMEDNGVEKYGLSELIHLRKRRIQIAVCADEGLLGFLSCNSAKTLTG